MEDKSIGEGYIEVKQGDVILKGDEYISTSGDWIEYSNPTGETNNVMGLMRRKIVVGEGYVEVKRGETILEGDEYWDSTDKGWLKYPFAPSNNHVMTLMRRKVKAMETKFKVGDRVRQIEGGWGTNDADNGKEAIVTEINGPNSIVIQRLGGLWRCNQHWINSNGFELVANVKMKEMQINNCTLEQRKAIVALADVINLGWNKHMKENGNNYLMAYQHFGFNYNYPEGFYGFSSNRRNYPIVTFQEFIIEMLKYVPVVKDEVFKLNDSYSVTIDKKTKNIRLSHNDVISFDKIDELFQLIQSNKDDQKYLTKGTMVWNIGKDNWDKVIKIARALSILIYENAYDPEYKHMHFDGDKLVGNCAKDKETRYNCVSVAEFIERMVNGVQKKDEQLILNDHHTAEVQKSNKVVVVGCQQFSFDVVANLHKAIHS